MFIIQIFIVASLLCAFRAYYQALILMIAGVYVTSSDQVYMLLAITCVSIVVGFLRAASASDK
jgi:hypothetical protein